MIARLRARWARRGRVAALELELTLLRAEVAAQGVRLREAEHAVATLTDQLEEAQTVIAGVRQWVRALYGLPRVASRLPKA